MIRQRVITLIEEEGLTSRKLEELTGIDRYKWGHIKSKNQRLNSDHLEAIVKIFPEYAFWLTTGEELPESGQISPMTKKAKQDLNQQRKA